MALMGQRDEDHSPTRGVRVGEAGHPGPAVSRHAGADLRLRQLAIGRKAKKTRDLRMGAGAWDRGSSAGPPLGRDSVEKLLVHSVSDTTALRIYLPNVR
eukprot:4722130-Heterocapsa_arctica.AAC.1